MVSGKKVRRGSDVRWIRGHPLHPLYYLYQDTKKSKKGKKVNNSKKSKKDRRASGKKVIRTMSIYLKKLC